MTVIRPNSVSGITSITAQANEINFFRSNGALAGLQLNGVNFNTTTGVSTFNNLDVGGVLTYQDVTNVDSVGIITARSTIDAQGDVSIVDKIIHTGDTNTAIRFPAADTVTIETGGSEKLRINSTGLITTNVSSTIFADINTTNSAGAYCNFDIGANGANIGYLGSANHLTGGGATDDLAIRATNNFKLQTGGSTTRLTIANTGQITHSTSATVNVFATSASNGAYLHFNYGASGALTGYIGAGSHLVTGSAVSDFGIRSNANIDISTGGSTRRLRITSAGQVAIRNSGTTSQSANLIAFGDADNTDIAIFSGGDWNRGLKISTAASGNNDALVIFDAQNADNGCFSFKTHGDERLRIASDGEATFSATNINVNRNAGDAFIALQTSGTSNVALYGGASSGFRVFTKPSGGSLTERLKVTNDGYSKHTSGGGYDSYPRAVQAHEFRQYENSSTLWTSCTNTSQTWEVIRADSARSGTSAMNMITTTTGNLGDDQHRLIGNGNILCDGTAGAGAADYAEYFEWTDSNSSNEDRRGMTVVLVDGKVRKTTSSDSADNIIGVVSANPVVVGDAQWRHWQSKYLRDDYGNYIYEDHNQITWTDDNGVKHDYEDWNVPSDVTVPNVGVTTTTHDENGIKLQHQKLNPSYDASKTYIPRSERKEWDAIGMVGKLRIRKGQITGTRWIKMKDISDTVEEWLVR